MIAAASRLAALLAALWAGVLAALGALVAPALFAALPPADAGRIAGRLFAAEADGSVLVGVLLLVVERARRRGGSSDPSGSQFSAEFALALGVVFCTVAGYFAVQPLMQTARAGQGRLSFGALHAISGSFFVLRGVLLLVLAWRLTGERWLQGVRPRSTSF